jgi:hypothetical protein
MLLAIQDTTEFNFAGRAALRGFIGRKSDDEPGVKVLWRGWIRLQDIVETWLLIHPSQDMGNA